MYRAFNLRNIAFDFNYSELIDKFNQNHSGEPLMIRNNIRDFILAGGELDGAALQNAFFPSNFSFNIFISHSHGDIDFAKAFAQFLENEFGLTCFIDSAVWGGLGLLQKTLDRYFKQNNPSYTLADHDRVASHVNLMLNIALMQMMDHCEALFFLNTPQSITVDDLIGDSTYSPWIFSEIGMFHLLRKREPKRLIFESMSFSEGIKQKVDLSDFTDLDCDDIRLWSKNYKKAKSSFQDNWKTALDVLYEMKPL